MPSSQKIFILLWKELHVLFNSFDGSGYVMVKLKQRWDYNHIYSMFSVKSVDLVWHMM